MFQIEESRGTDREYDAIAGILQAIWPDVPRSGAELATMARSQSAEDPQYQWIGWLDGTPVGAMTAKLETWQRAPGRYDIFVAVLPAYQGRGWGKQLYEHGLAHLTHAHTVSELFCETRADMTRGVQFLVARGYEVYKTTCLTEYRVANYDPAEKRPLLQGVLDADVQIASIRSLMESDDDWFGHYHAMRKEFQADMIYPPTEMTQAEHWQQHTSDEFYDPDMSFVALCEGEWAAYTELYRSPSDPGLYWTTLSGTRRKFRRRGLATALKVRAVEAVRERGGVRIRTDNDPRNPMYQINMKFGFAALPDALTYRKDV